MRQTRSRALISKDANSDSLSNVAVSGQASGKDTGALLHGSDAVGQGLALSGEFFLAPARQPCCNPATLKV
jgi:hypothetical protein